MSETSLIYRNVVTYRVVMNLLYGLKYRQRFAPVIGCMDGSVKRVLELCFGDIYIAEHCRRRGIAWIGLDRNPAFVAHAAKRGYDARQAILSPQMALPPADLCIMMASLYHFGDQAPAMVGSMLACAPRVVITEPIRNLSSMGGPIGALAHVLSNAGKGPEAFRFTEKSLMDMLRELSRRLRFSLKVVAKSRDIVVLLQQS